MKHIIRVHIIIFKLKSSIFFNIFSPMYFTIPLSISVKPYGVDIDGIKISITNRELRIFGLRILTWQINNVD